MEITKRELAGLLRTHICLNDYDGICIGCVCQGDREDWRTCRLEERDHNWHVKHIVDLAETQDEVYADQKLTRRVRAGQYSTITADMVTRTDQEIDAELRRHGFIK